MNRSTDLSERIQRKHQPLNPLSSSSRIKTHIRPVLATEREGGIKEEEETAYNEQSIRTPVS